MRRSGVVVILSSMVFMACEPDATQTDDPETQKKEQGSGLSGDSLSSDIEYNSTDTFPEADSVIFEKDTVTGELKPRIEYRSKGTGENVDEGDIVLITYTGRVKGGRIFDSSDKIGQPLGVKTGLNMLVPGWEQALLELREGDEVVIHIPSVLGYKDKGYGKLIPPNSDLIVEMKVEEIVDPVSADFGVKVYPLNHTDGKVPTEGDVVKIQYTGYLSNGRVYDTSHKNRGLFSFEVGERSVMPGLSYAVKKMSRGERAIVEIPAIAAYGPKGLQDIVPPNEDLTFILSLEEIEK